MQRFPLIQLWHNLRVTSLILIKLLVNIRNKKVFEMGLNSEEQRQLTARTVISLVRQLRLQPSVLLQNASNTGIFHTTYFLILGQPSDI